MQLLLPRRLSCTCTAGVHHTMCKVVLQSPMVVVLAPGEASSSGDVTCAVSCGTSGALSLLLLWGLRHKGLHTYLCRRSSRAANCVAMFALVLDAVTCPHSLFRPGPLPILTSASACNPNPLVQASIISIMLGHSTAACAAPHMANTTAAAVAGFREL